MKTAILAWDSMVRDPRDLEIDGPGWHEDGPLLPIEFATTSSAPSSRLPFALVLHDGATRRVPVLWAGSSCDDFQRAQASLASWLKKQHGEGSVGWVRLSEGVKPFKEQLTALGDDQVRREVITAIEKWLHAKGFGAAIWNDRPASVGDPLAWLKGLDSGKSAAARDYVERAPAQIRTELRERIEAGLGWLPSGTRPAPSNEWITAGEDLRVRDWTECRAVVGRLDGTLADLRKVGFSFITALLTASAFLGVSGGLNPPADAVGLRAGVFIAVMMLIAAVFSLDCYYQALLSGAVERALDLEVKTEPRIRLSKYLSVNARKSKVLYVSGALYLLLLMTTLVLGVIASGGPGLGVWESGPSSLPGQMSGIPWRRVVVAASAVAVGALATWWLLRRAGRLQSVPVGLAVGGPAAMALTMALAWELLDKLRGPSHAAASWVVAGGGLVALYIEAYWLYVTARCGLFRDKQGRVWPEGDGKVA